MKNPDCICDDLEWDEYCSEECDGPYEEWKERIEKEKSDIRKDKEARRCR